MTSPILVIFLGRKGAMARLFADVLEHATTMDHVHACFSHYHALPEVQSWTGPKLLFHTYQGMISCILSLMRMPWILWQLYRYTREHHIQHSCSIGGHPWHFFLLPLLRLLRISHTLCVHDGKLHPGEDSVLRRFLLRWNIHWSTQLVFFTRAAMEDLKHTLNAKTLPPFMITPLPLMQYGPSGPRSYPKGRGLRILFIGRILPYKGLDLLIEAFLSVLPTHPELHLTIAGDGDITVQQHPSITWMHRWIDEQEIPTLLTAADVIVAPYIEASQSGLVALGFGANVPVIVTPVGGLQEQITHLQTGIIASAVRADAIAAALTLLIQDPALYEHISQQMAAAHTSLDAGHFTRTLLTFARETS